MGIEVELVSEIDVFVSIRLFFIRDFIKIVLVNSGNRFSFFYVIFFIRFVRVLIYMLFSIVNVFMFIMYIIVM